MGWSNQRHPPLGGHVVQETAALSELRCRSSGAAPWPPSLQLLIEAGAGRAIPARGAGSQEQLPEPTPGVLCTRQLSSHTWGLGLRTRAPGPLAQLPQQAAGGKCWPRGEAFSGAFIPVLGGVGDKASKAFANVPSNARPVLPAVWVTALMDGVGGWCGEPGGGHWPPDKWVTY